MKRNFSYYKSKLTAWYPTNIPGCLLWLDASQGITKDASDYVSVWADQSGNGNNITQLIGARQPLWESNQIDGKPTLYFYNKFMEFATGFLYGLTDVSIFIVHRNNTAVNGAIIAPSTTGSAGLEITQYGWVYNNGVVRLNNSEKYNNLFLERNFAQANDIIYNASSTTGYSNKTLLTPSTGGGAALNYNGVYAIGRYYTSYYANDKIAEIIIYSASLSPSDRATVQNYLMKKYDLIHVTQSSFYVGSRYYYGYSAFDPATVEGWITDGTTTGYINVEYFNPKSFTTYKIKSRSGESGRAPKDWTLQGSNDGVNYTIIDTVTGSTAWGSDEERTFTIDTPGSYMNYKLVITANNGDAQYLHIKQITFV